MDCVGCVLGVDGGGSKTLCLVGSREGQILGMGRGGPSNHQVCGLERALGQITHAVRGALAQASATQASLGVFCLAGADLPEDYALLRQAIEGQGTCREVVVKNDTMAALYSGLSRPWGVVVVCGTGTNAAGRAPDGQEIVLPGLGHISGDWGGAADISQEAIRLVMRAWDGRGEPTALTEMVLDSLGVSSRAVLLRLLYHNQLEQKRLLELAPLVFLAADAGDAAACRLVRAIGTEVGVTARALIRRLSLADKDVEVVLAGSIFKAQGRLLIDTVEEVVHEWAPRASLVLPQLEPVVGALFMALEAAGVQLNEETRECIRSTLPEPLLICR